MMPRFVTRRSAQGQLRRLGRAWRNLATTRSTACVLLTEKNHPQTALPLPSVFERQCAIGKLFHLRIALLADAGSWPWQLFGMEERLSHQAHSRSDIEAAAVSVRAAAEL